MLSIDWYRPTCRSAASRLRVVRCTEGLGGYALSTAFLIESKVKDMAHLAPTLRSPDGVVFEASGLLNVGAKWAMSFTFDSIKKAVDSA